MSCLVELSDLKLVLWDFDGTLASTSGDVWGSLEYAASKRRRRFPVDFVDHDENLALSTAELYSLLVPTPDLEGLAGFERDVRVHYRSISDHPRTELYPGIRLALEGLHEQGIASWIVTNKPQGALERLLTIKGWVPLFDGWICSDSGEGADLSKEQMIKAVIERQGVRCPECLMIGDSWGDIEGARLAGVSSVGVTYGDGNAERLLAQRPDQVVQTSVELKELLLGD